MAQRWDVVYIDFAIPVGHEQGSVRPAVVVSYDALSKAGLATVCPVSSTKRALYPTEVKVSAGEGGLTMDSVVLVPQIRTVSQDRIQRVLGRITDPTIQSQIEAGLVRLLALGGRK